MRNCTSSALQLILPKANAEPSGASICTISSFSNCPSTATTPTGSKATLEDSFDGSIFAELQKADAGSEPTVDTTEPENPGDTSDAGHSEPENTTSSSHTETTPVEPDPGISVD